MRRTKTRSKNSQSMNDKTSEYSPERESRREQEIKTHEKEKHEEEESEKEVIDKEMTEWLKRREEQRKKAEAESREIARLDKEKREKELAKQRAKDEAERAERKAERAEKKEEHRKKIKNGSIAPTTKDIRVIRSEKKLKRLEETKSIFVTRNLLDGIQIQTIQTLRDVIEPLLNPSLDHFKNTFTSHIFKSEEYRNAISVMQNINLFLTSKYLNDNDLKNLASAYLDITHLLQKYEVSIKFFMPQEGYDHLKTIQKTIGLAYFELGVPKTEKATYSQLITRILKSINEFADKCNSTGMNQIKDKINKLETFSVSSLGRSGVLTGIVDRNIILDGLAPSEGAQLLYDLSCIARDRLRESSLKTFFGRNPQVNQAYHLLDKIRLMRIDPNNTEHLVFNQEGLQALADSLDKLNKSPTSPEPKTY